MITFRESTYKENQVYVDQYIKKLSNTMESFQEEHILESEVFSIFIDNKLEGYFAFREDVFEIKGFTVLTQFYLNPTVAQYYGTIFKKIIEEYDIKSAFVSTEDELFLSVAMDFHKSVTMQAYIHGDYIPPMKGPEYPRDCLVQALEGEFSEIQKLSGNLFDFLSHPRKKGKYQIYTLKDGETVLGFGLLEAGELVMNVNSLGIYTIEEHRKKGVGRSIMMHLHSICEEKGIRAITGCNWYNKKSKATLESAGFISQTRLLKVEFTEEKKWVSI